MEPADEPFLSAAESVVAKLRTDFSQSIIDVSIDEPYLDVLLDSPVQRSRNEFVQAVITTEVEKQDFTVKFLSADRVQSDGESGLKYHLKLVAKEQNPWGV